MKETIKFLREQKGFSQTYLASYLKISRQMYIKYETGEVDPPVKIVSALCKLYSVSYDVIIDDKFSQNSNVTYSIQQNKESVIASPVPSYAASTQENILLTNIISQLKKLPKKNLPSVSAFILLLQQEEKKSKALTENTKSKKPFFDLAGKIDLDGESVTSFRQESMI